ncbi:MAG: sigma-70 family RNA polymerase sigma factor [Myxococcota bacterium]|nr:sigma-70 family RNA polymerase sigma factor [Myxococcota bacterium]
MGKAATATQSGAASKGGSSSRKAAATAAPAAREEETEEVESKEDPDFEEPSSEQLAEAQAEAEKALKEMERQGGGDSTLSRYFREMASHRVLTPQEEIEAAKEVEKLEIGFWQALLSYPPAVDTVAMTIERFVTEQPLPELATLRKLGKSVTKGKTPGKLSKKEQDKWDETATALSTTMRALDSDRIFVNESDRAVHRAAGEFAAERDLVVDGVQLTPAFKKYLTRVEESREAQQQSKNRFVAANLRLVVSIARRYNRGRLPLIDLIQEGNIGLMKAVERFDHNRGYRFSTYASWWIRHAISRALADKGRAVRIPVHMLDTYNRVARATQAIATRTGQEPTPEELEKETGIAAEKLEKIKGYWAETPFSLDRPVNDEDGRKFIDFLEQENVPTPYEQLVSKTWSDEVRRLLDTLSPMEARILRWRFGLDDEDELTLKEIGDKYNLSRERIRQLQEQALAKIRRQIKE